MTPSHIARRLTTRSSSAAGHNGLTAAAYLARAGLSTLVLERRAIVGGSCVTEEIAPGCRASTTSYIASMLRPEVIRDLDLARPRPAHGALRSGAPGPVPRRHVAALVVRPRPHGRASSRSSRPRDAQTFVRVDDELKKLARYLQPFFLEPPPDVRRARAWPACSRRCASAGASAGSRATRSARWSSFLTGSLGDFLDRNYESEKVKTLFLANNVYGKHGGPYSPGTALGLLFHLLSGGEHELQGFYGHVIGGMGAITQAMAAAAREFGAEIRTAAPVARIDVRDGRARGVVLEDGTEIARRIVLSNADPKRTFLGLVEPRAAARGVPARDRGHQDGRPLRQGELRALRGAARLRHAARRSTTPQRALFTLVPSLEFAERCYDIAQPGEIPEELWVDCVVASNVDPIARARGPARHDLLRAVRPVPPAAGDLGREARAAGRPRRAEDRRVRAQRARRRSSRGRC